MILASFDNAEEDITARQVIEAKNEAETILTAVEKGEKTPAWQQLTSVEHEDIKAAALDLKASIRGGDYKIIRNAIERLDKKTTRFAQIMMDSAVTGALGGKTMQAASEGIDAGLNAPTSAPHAFAKAEFDKPNIIEQAQQDPETPMDSTGRLEPSLGKNKRKRGERKGRKGYATGPVAKTPRPLRSGVFLSLLFVAENFALEQCNEPFLPFASYFFRGSGVSILGSISGLVAALYANHASNSAPCITSPFCTRSYRSMLEWCVREPYSRPSCIKPMPSRPIHEKLVESVPPGSQ